MAILCINNEVFIHTEHDGKVAIQIPIKDMRDKDSEFIKNIINKIKKNMIMLNKL